MKMPSSDIKAQLYILLHDVRTDIINLDILTEKGKPTFAQEKAVTNKLSSAKLLLGTTKK